MVQSTILFFVTLNGVDFHKDGLVQKIFGYTLTQSILEDSNEQYI
jgi:hypothetical protein